LQDEALARPNQAPKRLAARLLGAALTRPLDSGVSEPTLGRLIRVIRSNKGREVTAEQIGVATVSRRAGLNPKANSQTKSKTSALARVQRLTLFGPPQLLEGEDAAAYDELLRRVCAAVKAVDVIDEMFIVDVVSLEWEILRWRRLKSSLLQVRGLKALENFLSEHFDYDQYRKFFEEDLTQILREHLEDQSEDIAQSLAHKCAGNEPDAVDKVNQIFTGTYQHMDNILESARARKAEELAQEYARRKPGAVKLIHKLLAQAGSSIDAIMAEAVAEDLDNIERIDRLTAIAETRRNAMLREIDRRRSVLGEMLRQQVQEVEGEFEVIEKPPAETKSAA
jgi:hypothetical protein